MTRLCMDCKSYLGEKCPLCGAVATLVNAESSGVAWYECSGCAVNFIAGEGGTTHGLCAKCLGVRNGEMQQRVVLSRGVQQEIGRGAQASEGRRRCVHSQEVGRQA